MHAKMSAVLTMGLMMDPSGPGSLAMEGWRPHLSQWQGRLYKGVRQIIIHASISLPCKCTTCPIHSREGQSWPNLHQVL